MQEIIVMLCGKCSNKKKPGDYVIATGKQYSIKQFVNFTAKKLDMKIIWKGKGIKEKAFNQKGNSIIECDKNYFRPLDVNTLLGDARKARKILKWKPLVNINTLIDEMIVEEYKSLNGIKKYIFYCLVSRFSKGIVLSNSLKYNLTPFIDESKIFCLPNFAQDYLYKEEKILVDEELRIFYLSNLMKEKGIICLLKALKNLERSNIKYKAKIAGNIDEKFSNEILKLINELEHTDYLGVVYGEAKKNLLAWGNIFVLPTFYKMEGQPISILEAMATKNVVVTTNHAGILDIFKDKVNGFLVQKNNIKSIQDILTYIAQNKSEIKKIATYNKGYFLENFTVNSFKENFIKIIN